VLQKREITLCNLTPRTFDNGTLLCTGSSAVSPATVVPRLTEQAKHLYLMDEFDREYRCLQRPSAAVAKACSAVRLADTLRSTELDDHEKACQYWSNYIVISSLHHPTATATIPETHRYVAKDRHRSTVNVNAIHANAKTVITASAEAAAAAEAAIVDRPR